MEIQNEKDTVYIQGNWAPKEAAPLGNALVRLYVYPYVEPHDVFVRRFVGLIHNGTFVRKYGCRPPERHLFNRWIDLFEPVRVRIYLANPGMILDGQVDGIEFDEIEVCEELSVIEQALNRVRRVSL